MTTLSNIITPSNVLTTTNTATVTNKTLTSPTVTGMVVSDGTANGVTYLNGSKVLTSGSALTFDGSQFAVNAASGGINMVVSSTGNTGLRVVGGTGAGLGSYLSLQAQGGNAALIGTEAAVSGSGTSTNLMLFGYGSNSIIMAPSTAEVARFTSTGLGIGTSSPSTKIVASGTTTALDSNGQILATVTDAVAADKGGQIMMGGYYTGTTPTAFAGIAGKKENGTSGSFSGYLQFLTSTGGTGNTEKARIDSSGNLLVGTTSVIQGAKISIKGSTVQSGLGIDVDTTSAGAYSGMIVNRTASDGDVSSFLRAGTLVGKISVTTSATSYNTSSDYRLKNTITPMTGALAKVALLKPCTYKWNVDGSDGEGFIAHELAEVCPHAVTGEKDAVDVDGNPKYQGIDTSFLVATLTSALQELNAKFEAYVAAHP